MNQVESFKLVLTNHIPAATVSNDLTKYNLTVSLAGGGIPAALSLYLEGAGSEDVRRD